MTLEIGQPAPDFTLATDGGGTVSLSALAGKRVVLYFYPKDDTPGCTREACAFRDQFPDFSAANAVVIGVSKDGAASHDKFKAKYQLPFTLAADTDTALAQAYGVWIEKKNYGKTYLGVIRSTFVISDKGRIEHAFYNVKATGHVAKLIRDLGLS